MRDLLLEVIIINNKMGGRKVSNVISGTSDQSKLELRVQMAEKIMAASKKQLKPPSYVFRPPPRIVKAEDVYEKRKKKPDLDLKLEDIVMLPVFKYLTSADLATSGCVCKAWHTISLDPSLWTVVDLTSNNNRTERSRFY